MNIIRFTSFLVFIQFLVFTNTSFSQSLYNDYQRSETFFSDDFLDNKNGWPIGFSSDSCTKSKITNENLEITSLCKNIYPILTIAKRIDLTKDFEIEAEIQYFQGEMDNALSLIWGKDESYNRYMFSISGNGYYKVSQYDAQWILIKDWTISDNVNSIGYNKLTVRKIGKQYYLFLNENFVYTFPFIFYKGDQLGFQDNQNTTMKVKALRISYLEKNPKSKLHPAETMPMSNTYDPFRDKRLGASISPLMGFIYPFGEIKDVYKGGWSVLDLMVGYRFLPNLGVEGGMNVSITGIANNKHLTLSVTNGYSNSTVKTKTGTYMSFPYGLKITFPINQLKSRYITIGGGGNYCWESESLNVEGYTNRRTSGYGYYARIAYLKTDKTNKRGGLGFQIRYTVNNVNVSDYYKDFSNGGIVTKSHAIDSRLLFVFELSWL